MAREPKADVIDGYCTKRPASRFKFPMGRWLEKSRKLRGINYNLCKNPRENLLWINEYFAFPKGAIGNTVNAAA